MSDRKHVLTLDTGVMNGTIDLYMDGESGTWRLFVNPNGAIGDDVDFTLDALRLFAAKLIQVLGDIKTQPDEFNAEIRKTWDVETHT